MAWQTYCRYIDLLYPLLPRLKISAKKSVADVISLLEKKWDPATEKSVFDKLKLFLRAPSPGKYKKQFISQKLADIQAADQEGKSARGRGKKRTLSQNGGEIADLGEVAGGSNQEPQQQHHVLDPPEVCSCRPLSPLSQYKTLFIGPFRPDKFESCPARLCFWRPEGGFEHNKFEICVATAKTE
eukprot:sb/3471457/